MNTTQHTLVVGLPVRPVTVESARVCLLSRPEPPVFVLVIFLVGDFFFLGGGNERW